MGATGGVLGGVGAAAAITGSVYQGLQQRRAQRRGERAQEAAQDVATRRAAAEVRRSAEDERRLNRKKPSLTSLLKREKGAALTGPGSTLLTGATGVNRSNLLLGRSSTLGGS